MSCIYTRLLSSMSLYTNLKLYALLYMYKGVSRYCKHYSQKDTTPKNNDKDKKEKSSPPFHYYCNTIKVVQSTVYTLPTKNMSNLV